MEPLASGHSGSPRMAPHRRETRSLESLTGRRSGALIDLGNGTSAPSNGLRHHSDRSTSSSRYTGVEPLSEHHAEPSIGPKIVPPSPSASLMDGNHHSSNFSLGFGTPPDYKSFLSEQLSKPGQVGTMQTSSSPRLLQPDSSMLNLRPPVPPGHFPRQAPNMDESDSSLSDRSANPYQAQHPFPPRMSRSAFPLLQAGALQVPVVPPPPPTSSPRHGRRRHVATKLGHKKRPRAEYKNDRSRSRSSSSSSSSASGSTAFSYRKRRTHRPQSASTDSSEDGVDPISARNARVFPPRLPADTAPASKSAAIQNIRAFFHQNERGHARIPSRDMPFIPPPPPPPPTGIGTGKAVDSSSSSGYSSDASSGSDSSMADTIEHLWQALKDKRNKVAEVKNEMSRQRRELRALRRKRDDADNALMNFLRPLLVNPRSVWSISQNILRERLYEAQDLWNEYNHREAYYEGQELLLDEEEESLNYMEIRFFSVLAAGRTDKAALQQPKDRNAKTQFPIDVPLELRGISPEGPKEELHPLYEDLASTVGDLQNAKEQLAETVAEREALEADIAVKRSTEQKIPMSSIKFLEEFRQEEKRLGQLVENLQAQTEKLKKTCEAEGIMRKQVCMSIGMQYFLDPTLEYESEIDLDDDASVENPLRHERFPELLSQPDHVMAEPMPLTTLGALERAKELPMDDPSNREKLRIAQKEYNIENLLRGHEQQDSSEFVNSWLLQVLQLSPLAASCLYDTFIARSRLMIRNPILWQKDVLHYWYRDGTHVQYVENPDQEFEDRKMDNSVRVFSVDTPPLSMAVSKAESAPQRSTSPMSRATDITSAQTLDGNLVISNANGSVDAVEQSNKSADVWSGTKSPRIMMAQL